MIIKAQRGRGKKLHLLIDDVYEITTDIDFWYDHFIPDGTELTEDAWEQLCGQIQYRKALHKAMDFLSRRDHSRKELLRKLMRTFDRETAERTVARMDALGYVDDEKYARTMSAHFIEGKKFSVSRVRRELAARGVERNIIDLVLDETVTDPVAQILSLLRSKYARKLSDEKGKRQTVSALQRLGYSYGDIRSAFYRCDTEFDEYEE